MFDFAGSAGGVTKKVALQITTGDHRVRWSEGKGYEISDSCGLERVGKVLELEKIEFPIDYGGYDRKNRETAACQAARQHCPEGWEPELHFRSQGSFFTRDGQPWARTSIRRWVDKKANEK